MKVKELPISERPYEKLEMYGEKTLSNAELIAIIIKCGTKDESSVSIAQRILALEKNGENNLSFLQNVSIQEFMSIKGIGKVKAIQLKAICELTRRMSKPFDTSQTQINSPKDVARILTNEMRYEKREVVKAIILNSKNVIIKIVDICTGGTNFVVIKPKDILHEVIKLGAPKIILVHNHPSGDPTPSKKDFEFTKRLLDAANIMGINLLDHVVIGEYGYASIFQIMLEDEKNKNN